MVTSELGACEWFVWDLRRSNLLDRGQLDQIIGEYLAKNPRAEPPALAEYLVGLGILTQFQADRLLQGKTQGFVLGPFTLMDSLGAGSMGTVYKAQSKTDNQWYAVKVLPRRSMWNVRLARRKVRAFEQAKHAAVVPFVDVGTSGGMHYLAWPLVEGITIERRVREQGKLSPGLAAHYALQIAEGLNETHKQTLIHGLLKPSNVMIAPDNDHVHILDFGIGCLLAETEGESMVDTMSTANAVASGLDCASPESIMEPTNLTPAGDQYSLGCSLYFMLAGQYPFPDGNAADKMMAHQFKQPTPLGELAPDAPPALVAVIQRLMQKAPEQRYASSVEVVDALKPFASKGSGMTARPRPSGMHRTTNATLANPKTPAPAPSPRLANAAGVANPSTPKPPSTPLPKANAPTAPAAPAPLAGPRAGGFQPPASTNARPATMRALPTRDYVRPKTNPPEVNDAPYEEEAPQPPGFDNPDNLRTYDQGYEREERSWAEKVGPSGIALLATLACCTVFAVCRYFNLL